MPKRIRVHERKLGREKALGLSYGDGNVEVDPRQSPKEYLDTVVHECLHELFPDASEEKVSESATSIARTLWRLRFRRLAD